MATERQSPDAILAITSLTPNDVTYIQDDPDSYDGNWLVADGNSVNTDVRTSFPTPTGNPTVGADLQEFKAWVRQFDTGQTGDPTCRIELREDGVLVRAGSEVAITGSGQMVTFTWDANELGVADGSLVECKIVGTKSGGGPSKRNTVDVGAVEWNVVYSTAVIEWLAGTLSGVGSISGAIKCSRKLSGTLAGAGSISAPMKVARKISGTLLGIGSLSGTVKRNRTLAGTLAGSGLASGALTVVSAGVKWLAGTLVGAGQAVGNLKVSRTLSGILSGTGQLSGSVKRYRGLSGVLLASGTLTGNLLKKLLAPPGRGIKTYDDVPGDIWV